MGRTKTETKVVKPKGGSKKVPSEDVAEVRRKKDTLKNPTVQEVGFSFTIRRKEKSYKRETEDLKVKQRWPARKSRFLIKCEV
jgi:hypothetical protein